jgi:hypothetical protein
MSNMAIVSLFRVPENIKVYSMCHEPSSCISVIIMKPQFKTML